MTTLYVTEPGATLRRDTGRLIVSKGGKDLAALPAPQVDGIVLLPGASVTMPVLTFLLDNDIALMFLSATGGFRGRLSTGLTKNIALRRQQYRRADDPVFSLGLARAIVAGKLTNCRVRCLEMDDSKQDPVIAEAIRRVQRLAQRAAEARDHAELMGIEGEGTQQYFEVMRRTLRPPWVFERRARRPPPDPVNALLSLLATFLHETCFGILETAGLDPYCGFLHAEHYGRASLALDLMEEFRPVIADALTLLLLNKRLVSPESFVPVDGGGIHLTRDGFRVVVEQYQQRLESRLRRSRASPRLTYRQLIEEQARRLREVINGETPVYEPFRSR